MPPKQKPRFLVLAALTAIAAVVVALVSAETAFSTPRTPLVVVNGRTTQLPTTDSLAATITGCGAGSAMQSVASNGSATCIAAGGGGTVSTDGASIGGTGSAGNPLHTTIANACGADRAYTATNSIGVPTCSLFVDQATSGGGLVVSGAGAGMRTDCSAGQYLAFVAGAWTCTSAGTIDNAFYGTGLDGALVFDGTSTVLGIVPSASTYKLNRDIFATTVSISTGVTLDENSFRIFASTSLAFGSSTSIIENDGHAATSSTGGGGADTGSPGAGSGSIGDTNITPGGGNTGSPGDSASFDPLGFTGSGGAGGHGGAGASGGAGGTIPTPAAPGGGGWSLTELLEQHLLNDPVANRYSCGAGGAGGGAGTDSAGGGGGGGGGCVFVASPAIAGAGKITAKGGNGANGANGTSGGGGGGGGGGGLVVVVTSTLNAPTYTVNVSGGTAGSAGTGGSPSAGTAGSSGRAVTLDPGSPGNGGSVTGYVSSVTCGTGLTGGTFTSTGTCAVDFTQTQAVLSGGVTNATTRWTSSSTLGNGTTTDNGTTFTVGQLAGTHVQESTTGTFNDYALSSATTWLEFSNTTAPTVTGIQGGVDGRLLYVSFTGTSGNLGLSNESASSSAANRVHGLGAAANNIANNGGGVLLLYDGVASRWRPLFMGTLPSLNVSGNTSLSSGTTTLGTTNISSAVNLTMSSTSQLHDAGTAPTLSTCGTSPTVTGGNIGGTIVTGTGAAACTATFARTFTAAPTCLVNLRGGGSSPAIGTLNATTLTFTAAASTTYDYVCVGH